MDQKTDHDCEEVVRDASVGERELWTIGAFAHAHGLSVRAVYLLLERKVLEGRKVGRRTLITEASRRRWLQKLPRFESSSGSKP